MSVTIRMPDSGDFLYAVNHLSEVGGKIKVWPDNILVVGRRSLRYLDKLGIDYHIVESVTPTSDMFVYRAPDPDQK